MCCVDPGSKAGGCSPLTACLPLRNETNQLARFLVTSAPSWWSHDDADVSGTRVGSREGWSAGVVRAAGWAAPAPNALHDALAHADRGSPIAPGVAAARCRFGTYVSEAGSRCRILMGRHRLPRHSVSVGVAQKCRRESNREVWVNVLGRLGGRTPGARND